MIKLLNNIFKINSLSSSVKKEVIAGIITFFSMSYIIFVNPIILSKAGMSLTYVFIATCLTIGITAILMAFIANMPLIIAPGMGLNALFVYTIVLQMGYTWQQALTLILVSGIVMIVFLLCIKKDFLQNMIPLSLRHGITAGIGMFVIFIALQNSGFVVSNPSTLVSIGNLLTIKAILIIIMFFAIIYGFIKNFYFIPILSLIILCLVSYFTEESVITSTSIEYGFGSHFDFNGIFNFAVMGVLITILFSSFFDSMGVIYSYTYLSNRKDLNFKKPMYILGISNILAAFFGTSSSVIFLESNSGVVSGGRTGLVALVVGILCLLCLFLAPLVSLIPVWVATPILLYLGIVMLSSLQHVNWNDVTEYVPAIIALILMPLGYSIIIGLAASFISYIILKLIFNKYKDLTISTIILGILFILSFIL